jgi:hypothetical protein
VADDDYDVTSQEIEDNSMGSWLESIKVSANKTAAANNAVLNDLSAASHQNVVTSHHIATPSSASSVEITPQSSNAPNTSRIFPLSYGSMDRSPQSQISDISDALPTGPPPNWEIGNASSSNIGGPPTASNITTPRVSVASSRSKSSPGGSINPPPSTFQNRYQLSGSAASSSASVPPASAITTPNQSINSSPVVSQGGSSGRASGSRKPGRPVGSKNQQWHRSIP